jgi:hypothetical protein
MCLGDLKIGRSAPKFSRLSRRCFCQKSCKWGVGCLGSTWPCISLHRRKIWLYPLSTVKLCCCMIRFVQQISSVDFQKEELDQACWGSSRIRVAGMVWEKGDHGVALQGRGKDFPEANRPVGHAFCSTQSENAWSVSCHPSLLQVQMQEHRTNSRPSSCCMQLHLWRCHDANE